MAVSSICPRPDKRNPRHNATRHNATRHSATRHSATCRSAGALSTAKRGVRANSEIGKQLQVFVRENNVDQALRILKKKMQREGIFREMKRRKAYEKPSERKTREKAEAIRRVRKDARKQAQRDGLIPMPKRREDARRSISQPRSF